MSDAAPQDQTPPQDHEPDPLLDIFSPDYEGWGKGLPGHEFAPYQDDGPDQDPDAEPELDTGRTRHTLVDVTVNDEPRSVPASFCCVYCARGAFSLALDQVLLYAHSPPRSECVIDIGALDFTVNPGDDFVIRELRDLITTDDPQEDAYEPQGDDQPLSGPSPQMLEENAATSLLGVMGTPVFQMPLIPHPYSAREVPDDIDVLAYQLLPEPGRDPSGELTPQAMDMLNAHLDLVSIEETIDDMTDSASSSLAPKVSSGKLADMLTDNAHGTAARLLHQPRSSPYAIVDHPTQAGADMMAYDPLGLITEVEYDPDSPAQAPDDPDDPDAVVCDLCLEAHEPEDTPHNMRPCHDCGKGMRVLESLVRYIDPDGLEDRDSYGREFSDVLERSCDGLSLADLPSSVWRSIEALFAHSDQYPTVVLYRPRCTYQGCKSYRRPPPELN